MNIISRFIHSSELEEYKVLCHKQGKTIRSLQEHCSNLEHELAGMEMRMESLESIHDQQERELAEADKLAGEIVRTTKALQVIREIINETIV